VEDLCEQPSHFSRHSVVVKWASGLFFKKHIFKYLNWSHRSPLFSSPSSSQKRSLQESYSYLHRSPIAILRRGSLSPTPFHYHSPDPPPRDISHDQLRRNCRAEGGIPLANHSSSPMLQCYANDTAAELRESLSRDERSLANQESKSTVSN
jgi:hypothetical protein